MKEEQDKHKRVQSIEVGFFILHTLSVKKQGMSLSELSKETGLHKSQLYRYLNSFVHLGVLTRNDGDITRWSLGPEIILLGNAAYESLDIAKVATVPLVLLRNTLNETTSLSIWKDNGPFFVRWERSSKLENTGVYTGLYVPLYTASGKIFRAFLPEEQTQHLYDKEIELGYINPKEYDEEIKKIRQTRLATTSKSMFSGVSVISTPIFYSSGQLAGVISVVGITGYFDISMESEPVRELFKTARNISERLGYYSEELPVQG